MMGAAGQAFSLANEGLALYQFVTGHLIAALIGTFAWEVTKHFVRLGFFNGIALAFESFKNFVHTMWLLGQELFSPPDPQLLDKLRRRDAIDD